MMIYPMAILDYCELLSRFYRLVLTRSLFTRVEPSQSLTCRHSPCS